MLPPFRRRNFQEVVQVIPLWFQVIPFRFSLPVSFQIAFFSFQAFPFLVQVMPPFLITPFRFNVSVLFHIVPFRFKESPFRFRFPHAHSFQRLLFRFRPFHSQFKSCLFGFKSPLFVSASLLRFKSPSLSFFCFKVSSLHGLGVEPPSVFTCLFMFKHFLCPQHAVTHTVTCGHLLQRSLAVPCGHLNAASGCK